MSDCSKHKKEVAGISDTKILARLIVDSHYEWQANLWKEVSNCYKEDSRKDWKDKKIQLAHRLKNAANNTKVVFTNINDAWQICKPFMETKNQ